VALVGVAGIWPGAALIASLPAGLYALVLAWLAGQGTLELADWRAGLAIPAYAVALHVGYGAGYLVALVRPDGYAGKRIDWDGLRAFAAQSIQSNSSPVRPESFR
jgi:hypothetical protein